MYHRRQRQPADEFVSRYLYLAPEPLKEPEPFTRTSWPSTHHHHSPHLPHRRSPFRDDGHINREREASFHLRRALSPHSFSDSESLQPQLSPPPFRSAGSQGRVSTSPHEPLLNVKPEQRDGSCPDLQQSTQKRSKSIDRDSRAAKGRGFFGGDSSDEALLDSDIDISCISGDARRSQKSKTLSSDEEGLSDEFDDMDPSQRRPSGGRGGGRRNSKMVRQTDELIVEERVSETVTVVGTMPTSPPFALDDTTKSGAIGGSDGEGEMRSESSEMQQSLEKLQQQKGAQERAKQRQREIQKLRRQQKQLAELEEQTQDIKIEQSFQKLQKELLQTQLTDIEEQISIFEADQRQRKRRGRYDAESANIDESIRRLQRQKQKILDKMAEEVRSRDSKIHPIKTRPTLPVGRPRSHADAQQQGQGQGGQESFTQQESQEMVSQSMQGGQGEMQQSEQVIETTTTVETEVTVVQEEEEQGGCQGGQQQQEEIEVVETRQRQKEIHLQKIVYRDERVWWFERQTKLIGACMCCILFFIILFILLLLLFGFLYFFFGFFGGCVGVHCHGAATATATAVSMPAPSGCVGVCPQPCGIAVRRVCALPPPVDTNFLLHRMLLGPQLAATPAGVFYRTCITATPQEVEDSAVHLLANIVARSGGWSLTSAAHFGPAWSLEKAWRVGAAHGLPPLLEVRRRRRHGWILRALPTPVVPMRAFVHLGRRVAAHLDSDVPEEQVIGRLMALWRRQKRRARHWHRPQRPQRWRLGDFEHRVLHRRLNVSSILAWEMGRQPRPNMELYVLQPREIYNMAALPRRQLNDLATYHTLAVLLRHLSPPLLGRDTLASRWKHCVRLTQYLCPPPPDGGPAAAHRLTRVVRRSLLRSLDPASPQHARARHLRIILEQPEVQPMSQDFVLDLLKLERARILRLRRCARLNSVFIPYSALWSLHLHHGHPGLALGHFGGRLAESALSEVGAFQRGWHRRPCDILDSHRAALAVASAAFKEMGAPKTEWRHFFGAFARHRCRHSPAALETLLGTDPHFAQTYGCVRTPPQSVPLVRCPGL